MCAAETIILVFKIIIHETPTQKKSERGFMANLICQNSGVVLTKWLDNSAAILCSNFVGVDSHDICQL